jgi:hypothetical protein
MSYMETLSFSFTGDAGVLRDLDRISEFLAEDFWALRAAVAKPPAAARPVAAREAVRAVTSSDLTQLAVVAPAAIQDLPPRAVTLVPNHNNGDEPGPSAGPARERAGEDDG